MVLWEFLSILNSNRVDHKLVLEQVDDDFDNCGMPIYRTKHICTFALKFDVCEPEDDRFTNEFILRRYYDYEVIRFNLNSNTIEINNIQVDEYSDSCYSDDYDPASEVQKINGDIPVWDEENHCYYL